MDTIRFSGEALKRARLARGWGRADLARRIEALGLNCSRQQIGAWETGKATPGGNWLLALVALFGGGGPLVERPDGLAVLAEGPGLILGEVPDGGRFIIGRDGQRKGPLTDREAAGFLANPAMMEMAL